jgi:hypothetical protein
VGPKAGLDGCGKPRPTGIRSPDRPARSKSLYRLSYPGPSHGGCIEHKAILQTVYSVTWHTDFTTELFFSLLKVSQYMHKGNFIDAPIYTCKILTSYLQTYVQIRYTEFRAMRDVKG